MIQNVFVPSDLQLTVHFYNLRFDSIRGWNAAKCVELYSYIDKTLVSSPLESKPCKLIIITQYVKNV